MWHTPALFEPGSNRVQPVDDYSALPLWRVDRASLRKNVLHKLMSAAHLLSHSLDASVPLASLSSLLAQLVPGAHPAEALKTLGISNVYPAVHAALRNPSAAAPADSCADPLLVHLSQVNETVAICDQLRADISDSSCHNKHLAHQIVLLHTCMIKMGDPLAPQKKSVEQYFDTIKKEISGGELSRPTADWLLHFLGEVRHKAQTARLAGVAELGPFLTGA
eukprot:TRINITY_DN16411_c0_g1_i1.p1 TRINITY_DN16411_c0_g1~~TRINITY_DN16411_c0_g1_i1.p1  ORF type:complete len:221 (+),score=62.29 TRINITY_DN16411_c0_g1_i1:62-724(+)